MKLLAGILKTLLVDAFKGNPNICDLWVSSQKSWKIQPRSQSISNNYSVRGLVYACAWKTHYDRFYACPMSLQVHLNTKRVRVKTYSSDVKNTISSQSMTKTWKTTSMVLQNSVRERFISKNIFPFCICSFSISSYLLPRWAALSTWTDVVHKVLQPLWEIMAQAHTPASHAWPSSCPGAL